MSYRCHVRRHEVMFGGSGCVVLLQDRNYGRWWRKYEITHRKNSYFLCQKNLWLSSHREPSTADFILISLDDVRNITAPIWVNHCWKKRHSWTPDLYSDNYFRKWKVQVAKPKTRDRFFLFSALPLMVKTLLILFAPKTRYETLFQ